MIRLSERVAPRRRRPAEAPILLVVLGLFGVLCALAILAGGVLEGHTAGIDRAILLWLRNPADLSDPLGPRWVEELGRDVTAFGGLGALAIISLSVAGFLWLQGNRRSMWLLLASVGGGRLASSLMKLGFDRPRPDLVPHGSIVYSTSFPSAHSMMAAIVYLTLAVLVARVQPRLAVKIYLIALAALMTVAVGISRVYLGVHWPTDVLAGWVFGTLWAVGTLEIARWLERRGAADPEKNATG